MDTKQDFKAAEATAPVNQTGPLPYEVNTLQFIPAARHPQYERTMTGSFRLAYLNTDDSQNMSAHIDHITGGRIAMIPPGESASSWRSANERAESEMKKSFEAEMARLEEVQKADRLARIEQQRARDAAELARKSERHKMGLLT